MIRELTQDLHGVRILTQEVLAGVCVHYELVHTDQLCQSTQEDAEVRVMAIASTNHDIFRPSESAGLKMRLKDAQPFHKSQLSFSPLIFKS